MTKANDLQTRLRQLPAIDELLRSHPVGALIKQYGRSLTTSALREASDNYRQQIINGATAPTTDTPEDDTASIVIAGEQQLQHWTQTQLRPVFNLTGTVLHTNLGRAPLPRVAIDAMSKLAAASNVEFDLNSGRRGDRDSLVETLICRLTGAEAATVVNNNAAAVLLVLNALARRREVLVSRGELVEIGGSFRIPDVMARAGAKLREVGTTNRTHAADYATAIDTKSALIMKVHTSNYVVEGFTAAVAETALAKLAHENELPFVVDLGSGTLIDLSDYGLPREQTVAETIHNGADIVTFSGDKLLGGPQCGVIAGSAALIKRIKKNPLKRALRVDKITLAALEAVLGLYLHPEALSQELPALRLLTRPQPDIQQQAERLLPRIAAALNDIATVSIEACKSQIGSGAMPVDVLPSAAFKLMPTRGGGRAPERLAKQLRQLEQPIIGRVADGALWLDLRCLDDEALFINQLETISSGNKT